MALPPEIVPVQRDENFIKIMLYGEPGIGKSIFAGSGSRTLLLINDNDEASSVADWGSTAHKWVVRDYEDMEKAYEYVRHEGYKYYEWVWIDNATLLQEQAMFDQILPQLVARKPARSLWVPDQHEYLVNQNQLATYIRRFKAIPIHFGVTANVMRAEDDDGRVIYLPLFQGGQGQLSQKICGYMGIVAYMYQLKKGDQYVRSIITAKRGKFYAKSRFKGMPNMMEAPTVPKMMEAIRRNLPTLGQAPGAPRVTPIKKTTPARRRAS